MVKYFASGTPLAGMERMMMSVPRFQPRGAGVVSLGHFRYRAEDLDCRYCLHYQQRSCQVRACPYIAERLEAGASTYRDLVLECFGTVHHLGLQRRLRSVTHWEGPDQAAWDRVRTWRQNNTRRQPLDAAPNWLAAACLLAAREPLWKAAAPALSSESIDFSKFIWDGFDVQNYPLFYAAKRLYEGKPPMSAEALANRKLVDEQAFHAIIVATLIAWYGPAILQYIPSGIWPYHHPLPHPGGPVRHHSDTGRPRGAMPEGERGGDTNDLKSLHNLQ